jgi:hypothetical protein|nr:MAG TPA: hypothetical protein [Caudoviricetes sp.]
MKPQTLGKHSSNSRKKARTKLRAIKTSQSLLNKITICNIYVPEEAHKGWGNSSVFEGDRFIKVSQSLAWAIDNIRVKWDILCGVFLRDQKGVHFIHHETFRASEECVSSAVSEYAQKLCAYMYYKAPRLQRLVPFWLAVPRSDNKDIDINLAIRAAHRHKVFNRVGTMFEINCNIPEEDFHTGDWFDIPMDYSKFVETEYSIEEAMAQEYDIVETDDGKVMEAKDDI